MERMGCYQSQNYKIWKQFTTMIGYNNILFRMLSITKLQNLKAIHNTLGTIKKQVYDVINHKTTKFESSSQQTSRLLGNFLCCYQSQNYKIWKQFTTQGQDRLKHSKMLSITKLQNLKAIHNYWLSQNRIYVVVINHKTTKFESNSQLNNSEWYRYQWCYQSQNYKIWKQFTTPLPLTCSLDKMLSITKLQNLKAIHNPTDNKP